MKRKTPIAALMCVILMFCAACGGSGGAIVKGKVNVVTSFYPLYDFTKKIGGEHVNVINLVPAGVEPHDWTPKSRDIANISQSQLFIYNGAGFEGWVPDFLGSLSGSHVSAIEASKGIQLLPGGDPHTWVSPLSALKMADNIRNSLIQADSAHKQDYDANYDVLAKSLQVLDQQFKSALHSTVKKEIVVSHQAFGYLCRDYGLTQMPIMGLSPDTEPTSKDLSQISEFIKQHHVKYIFFEELVSDKIAKTLAKDLQIETLVLNPLEGLTDAEEAAGKDYVTVMKDNLQNLLKALQ